jgi:glycosyltransferase involved in cell wall biosynthesis
MSMQAPRYSFVIPVLDEEATLPELFSRLTAVMGQLDGDAEAILVDDGSTDRTYELLVEQNARDPRFKAIRFARNFGHQIAITAGLDFAAGEATVIMDADLQDPPEVVFDLIERWRDGYEVVYAIREDRAGDSLFKRVTAGAFYRALRRLTQVDIPANVGDFRLVDRRALDEFRALRESNRYVRGMFTWIGFRQTGVRFSRSERFAGKTKYPYRRSLKLGIDGLISFSDVPLRIALTFGFLVSAAALVFGIVAIALKIAGNSSLVPGWASVVVATAFLGGVQLIVIGMMGLYVGRIYEEVRGRPLYIVRDVSGLVPAVHTSLGLAPTPPR